VDVHLIDGTYELFRNFHALPPARDADGREVGAVMRGVLASLLRMLRDGTTHVAVATDHVIESYRNDLWPGYKTSDGVQPDLLSQFQLLEDVLSAAGIVVWPMVELEADDALAAAAEVAAADARVQRVFICTPDKDLAQSVRGTRVVQLNRRTRETRDEAGVVARFGVRPESIPDYRAARQGRRRQGGGSRRHRQKRSRPELIVPPPGARRPPRRTTHHARLTGHPFDVNSFVADATLVLINSPSTSRSMSSSLLT
jgi:hypothetical protein